MNKVEFEKWVKKMIQEMQKGRNTERYCYGYRNNGTFVIGDRKTGKTGMSRKHPDDEYNFNYGMAIAYARCKGYEIPKITTYKKLSEMKYGEKFKVKNDLYEFIFIGENPLKKHYYIVVERYAGGVPTVEERCDNDEYEMVE